MPHIPLPVIADVYRTTFNWHESTSGQTAANVVHFKRPLGSASALFTDLETHVVVNMWYATVNTARITTVDIIKLDGSSATQTFTTTAVGWTGQGSATDFDVNSAYLVKFVTGVRGRANRGRIYLPFAGESQTTAGSITPAAVTAMNAAWNGFIAGMTTATSTLVIASYDRDHAGAAAHSTVVLSAAPELVMGTQRRRQQRLR